MKNTSFARQVHHLLSLTHQLTQESSSAIQQSLIDIKTTTLLMNKSLIEYQMALLFLMAHPPNKKILNCALEERNRLAEFCRKLSTRIRETFINSGLPFTPSVYTMSHDLTKWMMEEGDFELRIESIGPGTHTLSDVLAYTLPPIQSDITSAGYSNDEILSVLRISDKNTIKFIVSQFNQLERAPKVKDYFYDALEVIFRITPNSKDFSKLFNHLSFTVPFFHSVLEKKVNCEEVIEKRIAPINLTVAKKKELIRVIRHSLNMFQRETDPVTYLDEKSLRYFELERGISIVLYGMTASRQFPLESYVGYTVFKNGFPAAYGGGWVFGKRSLFGIHIFDYMRGGESSLILAQLLRVYKYVFDLSYFELEPSQYGEGSSEGIKTGAFWFYYKMGFRPIEKDLRKLAKSEWQLIQTNKSYRSSSVTLKKFTTSNMEFQLGKVKPLAVSTVSEKVALMIHEQFDDDRTRSESICVEKFLKKAGTIGKLNEDQQVVLKDMALLTEAFNIQSTEKIRLLKEMVKVKPNDLYKAQELWRKILENFR